jgi:hypothetical protein
MITKLMMPAKEPESIFFPNLNLLSTYTPVWSVRESTLVSQWLNDTNTEDAGIKGTRTNLLSESVLAINSLLQHVGMVFYFISAYV